MREVARTATLCDSAWGPADMAEVLNRCQAKLDKMREDEDLRVRGSMQKQLLVARPGQGNRVVLVD